jgi:hypothetical protein
MTPVDNTPLSPLPTSSNAAAMNISALSPPRLQAFSPMHSSPNRAPVISPSKLEELDRTTFNL